VINVMTDTLAQSRDGH